MVNGDDWGITVDRINLKLVVSSSSLRGTIMKEHPYENNKEKQDERKHVHILGENLL